MVAVFCQPFQHWGLFQAVHGHVRALQQFGFMISARGILCIFLPPQNPTRFVGLPSFWKYAVGTACI